MNALTDDRTSRRRVIPIALTLLAVGGYYVWCEISPMQRQNPASPPAIPLASAMPLAAPMEVPAPAISAVPAIPATKNILAASIGMKPPQIAEPHDTGEPRIEHTREDDAVDPAMMAAWQAYRNGNFEISKQRYSEVLHKDAQSRNTPNRDALLGMAAIAVQQAQDATASRYYGEVLMLDPRDPAANAGMSALETGDAATEESRLKLLLAHGQAAILHFVLGNLYAEQSRWGDASLAYFNACKLEQDNAQFAFNLAVSLDHLGHGRLASQHYQHALQLDASDNPGFSRAQTQRRIDELTAQ